MCYRLLPCYAPAPVPCDVLPPQSRHIVIANRRTAVAFRSSMSLDAELSQLLEACSGRSSAAQKTSLLETQSRKMQSCRRSWKWSWNAVEVVLEWSSSGLRVVRCSSLGALRSLLQKLWVCRAWTTTIVLRRLFLVMRF